METTKAKKPPFNPKDHSSAVDAIVMRTEVRRCENNQVDEVLLYLNDKCVFHLETMSEQAIWFAIYPDNGDGDMFWINAINGRSHIHINEQ